MIISFTLFSSIVPHLFYSLNNDTQSVVISAAQSQISKFYWVILADVEIIARNKQLKERKKERKEIDTCKPTCALKWMEEKENFTNDFMTSELFALFAEFNIIM